MPRCYAVSSHVGVVAVMLVVAHAVVGVSATGGGLACTLNVQCGQPAANMQQLREDAASITGSCENGVCVCANGYGCAGCHINGNTELSYLSEPWGTIDVCTNPFGGGLCTDDAECGNGLCLSGKCVCYSGWTCEYCQLGVNEDIRNHAQCGDYSTGSGSCATNDDCGGDSHGLCNAGECLCTPGYVCTDCSADRDNVLADLSSCPCKTGQCSGHGTCSNGICTCEENYTGSDCSVDLCAGKTCNGHGTCRAGTCECTGGYSGADCDTGGGECTSNADCGVFAPIPGSDTPNSQCDGDICVDGKYGGTCTAGQCVCNSGFTCDKCSAKGAGDCEEANGGAECTTADDCGPQDGGGTGGMCLDGRCVCYPGFVCPTCHTAGPLAAGETCTVDETQARGGAACTSVNDCGLNENGGTGGSCVDGKCSCYQGWYCPTCNTATEPNFAGGEKCPEQTGGGGKCFSNVDCKNGACVDGACVCYAGWDCDYCTDKTLVVGDRIPGDCTADTDCGTAIVRGGQCVDGKCECYPGFKCSMCNKWGTAECDADNYVREGDTLTCSPAPVLTGGKACASVGDCGELDDGRFGGQCVSGACSCWSGYTCQDCSRTFTEVSAGVQCSSASAMRVVWAVIAPAMLAVALALLA